MEPESLDSLVRRVDPDRWLSARFAAGAQARATLSAIYALNYELAHVAEAVTNPLMGEIRLAWWREGVEGLYEGAGARGHTVLEALGPPIRSGLIARDLVDRLIEARHADLEPAPFEDEAQLAAYIDGTAGAVAALAARALDRAANPAMTASAARAWGWAGLYRATAFWNARNRRWTPAEWGDIAEPELRERVGARVSEALAQANRELRELPAAAFPAIAYATLARAYAAGRTPSDLGKRLAVLGAVIRGRV